MVMYAARLLLLFIMLCCFDAAIDAMAFWSYSLFQVSVKGLLQTTFFFFSTILLESKISRFVVGLLWLSVKGP
jgi:hypothetical protein